MKLLPSQRNQVYDAITQAGFSPAQFKLSDQLVTKIHGTFTELSLNGSEYYYRFYENHGGHVGVFSPGHDTLSEQVNPGAWLSQLNHIYKWLSLVKREIEQPDKWQHIFDESKSIGINIGTEDNSQFTYEEVTHIQQAMLRAKAAAGQLQLTAQQLRLLSDKLDYVAEKAKLLGRIDWKNLFMGTMITMIVDLGVPDELKKQLWLILKESFKVILQIALK